MTGLAYRTVALLALGLIGAGPAPASADIWVGTEPAHVVAVRLSESLGGERFSEAHSALGTALSSRLSVSQLEATWRRAVVTNGRLLSHGRAVTRARASGQPATVVVPARFERATLDLRVSFDANTAVTGLLLTRRPPLPPTPVPGPPYGDESAFDELDVTVGTSNLAVPGRLSIPTGTGPFAAVVLLSGSGPSDMDETIGPNKPLRDVAWGLASRGIVILRFDKPTLTHGAALAPRSDLTVEQEYLEPAAAAIELLRSFVAEVDPERVFVFGHSLGGTVAPRVAAATPAVAGLVLLAGASQPLPATVLRQIDYLTRLQPPTTPAAQASFDLLRRQYTAAGDPDLSLATPRSLLPAGTPPAYWLDLRAHDPVATANAVPQPLLILQGDRDYQVTVADDLAGWERGLEDRAGVTVIRYPRADHLFFDGDGPSLPAAYFRPDHPIPAVVSDIATWIIDRP